MNGKIAVVDDDFQMGKLVKDMLSSQGYSVAQYGSVSEALAKFKTDLPNVVITDLRMKEIDGMMFLKKVQEDYPHVVSIMMTAFGSIETAIEAMRLGAYHYIVKPFKMEEITLLTERAMERVKLTRENKVLRKELKKEFTLESIVGKSPSMMELFDLIRRIASSTASILITGESGTGKELVARAIHTSGERRDKPFVPVNCTAIPSELLESELFGHVRGSFTGATHDKKGLFEVAEGGTLFLDEIGDLSLPLQAKLLRVLQDKQIRAVGGKDTKKIDVRIVTATHRDLKTMVQDGKFREDLFYRLNVIPLRVPALRDRPQDIPLLVDHFVEKFVAQNHSKVKGVAPDAIAALMAYPWPGNVRELENVIERAVVLSKAEMISAEEVLGTALESAKENIHQLFNNRPTLDQIEERYIRLVLAEVANSKEAAAQILGISRRTLYRKERVYGLVSADVPEPGEDDHVAN